MSNIISKIRQRIALKENNKFDLTCDHITTTDFFKLSPVYFKEMVPGEKISINQSTFTRLSPMINPMLGRCRIENRAFFVPMRTIMEGWNEFITDTPYEGVYHSVPTIDPKDLATALVVHSSAGSASSYDYTIQAGSPAAVTYKKFSSIGRQAWTILQSLGYRFPVGWYASSDRPATSDASECFSALPLLAFCKIWFDWFKPQAYTDSTFYNIFSMGDPNNLNKLTADQLRYLFEKIYAVTYDKDYFTSAWDTPTNPNDGLYSDNLIPDITYDGNTAAYGANVGNTTVTGNITPKTPAITGSQTNHSGNNKIGSLSQYMIDALKSLTDYVKRHQIAGGLAMDRMLSRFGMKPSDAALDRSIYLGKNTVNIQIADVMATGNGSVTIGSTSNKSVVGDYAGKGVGFGNGSFSYETKEYGYIIITSSLVPSVGYVQGCSRYNLHKDRLDFFTPEFDSLGVQAVARRELLSDYNGAEAELKTLTPDVALNGVFGYTSRYAEYKCAQDNLTGDFSLGSRDAGQEAWHLFRMLDPTGVASSDLTHSLDFVSTSDAEQYDRIFSLTGNTYDHFTNIHHFEITDYAPMAQMFDDYEFDGGKKEVSIEVNGTQLN